jgi:hypothetical protein
MDILVRWFRWLCPGGNVDQHSILCHLTLGLRFRGTGVLPRKWHRRGYASPEQSGDVLTMNLLCIEVQRSALRHEHEIQVVAEFFTSCFI